MTANTGNIGTQTQVTNGTAPELLDELLCRIIVEQIWVEHQENYLYFELDEYYLSS